MKTKLISTVVLICVWALFGYANPSPWIDIREFSIDPPWVEIEALPGLDYIGTYLTTMGGQAEILAFIPGPYIGLLDSSTTTGFILNPYGDSITALVWGPMVGFGCYGGIAGTPPTGTSMVIGYYPSWLGPPPDDIETQALTFDFCLAPTPAVENENHYAGGHWGTTGLIINEVNINCAWKSEADFIELYNTADTSVNTDNMLLIGHAIYDFPDGLNIAPGEYYVIDEIDFPIGFELNPAQDVIYLVIKNTHYPDGYQYAVVDQVGWSSDHGINVSFMRYPDGDADSSMFMEDYKGFSDETSLTFENGFPSRGAPNRHENPGFVAIGAKAKPVDEGEILIKWTDPIWDNEFELAVLVRNATHYPETYNDGEIIYQGTDQMFIDQTTTSSETIFYTVYAKNTDQEYSIPTSESRTSIGFETHAYLAGDVNMYSESWPPSVICGDVTYLVNFFRGMTSSHACLLNGFWGSADINGDCNVIGSDVTKLVNYFRGQGTVGFCPAYVPLWLDPGDLPLEAPSGWPNCE